MLGSYVSAAYETTPTPAVERFYSALLDWAGVVPPLKATGDRIEARLLETPNGPLVFVFNHTRLQAKTQCRVRMPAGDYGATDVVDGRTIPLTRDGDRITFPVDLPVSGVRCLR